MVTQTDLFNFDQAERNGHNLTLVCGPLAGYCHYWCEQCGAMVVLRQGVLEVWQQPAASISTQDRCVFVEPRTQTLKTKLRQLSIVEEWGDCTDEDDDDG